MGIDEGFVPGVGLIIAHLEDVGKLEGAVLLSNVLDGGFGELISHELAVQGLFTGLDSILNGDGSLRGLGCE